jgi:hypothetical protein
MAPPAMAGDGCAHRRAAGQAAAARHTAAADHAAAEPLAGMATPGQAVTLFVLPPSPHCRALPTTADPDRAMHHRGELFSPMVLCLSCYVLKIRDLGLGLGILRS